jgi:hypothetical protein
VAWEQPITLAYDVRVLRDFGRHRVGNGPAGDQPPVRAGFVAMHVHEASASIHALKNLFGRQFLHDLNLQNSIELVEVAAQSIAAGYSVSVPTGSDFLTGEAVRTSGGKQTRCPCC